MCFLEMSCASRSTYAWAANLYCSFCVGLKRPRRLLSLFFGAIFALTETSVVSWTSSPTACRGLNGNARSRSLVTHKRARLACKILPCLVVHKNYQSLMRFGNERLSSPVRLRRSSLSILSNQRHHFTGRATLLGLEELRLDVETLSCIAILEDA